MIVTIWSHFRDETWQGDVPDEMFIGHDILLGTGMNEALFRIFNRVDEADSIRLEAWGYRLPSLSVGDTVSYDGRTFRVDDFGFTETESEGTP